MTDFIFNLKCIKPKILVKRLSYLGTIHSTRFSLFFYKYPLLFPTHTLEGIRIADVKDIAPMKISALADRGTKRDFIDLYFIFSKARVLSPRETLELYDKKFGKLAQNKIHILKSFAYFEDANRDQMPKMIQRVTWHEVKKLFLAEQQKLIKTLIGI